MRNYDLYPETKIKKYSGSWRGYQAIIDILLKKIKAMDKEKITLAIECYPGIDNEEILHGLVEKLNPDKVIFADDAAFNGDRITDMVKRNLTDDRVFGVMSHFLMEEFFPEDAVLKEEDYAEGLTVVYGTGATIISDPDLLIYADLARWEIQQRYRKGMSNWKINNPDEDILKKYKRGYFFEWRIADRQKYRIFSGIDFLLDTNVKDDPKMITGEDYRYGLEQVVKKPFRVVPYFDSSVWGGQWMKEKFGLNPDVINYGWAFDGVPEENSLYLRYGDVRVEVPSMNLVNQYPDELLGPKVRSRFGRVFPIRFDYLDTMDGGNLSLQVHPLTEYIQDRFGMHYTQDESYYILDVKEDASVYLGVKNGTKLDELMEDLEKAQQGDYRFPDEKYINVFGAKKHDHFLIPAGTVHCGGTNTVMLEISASAYIFTFKLWDWERTGLDGRPRPVHLQHGRESIQTKYDTDWVEKNLINRFETLHEDDDKKIERTGLHELEFVETRRYWFEDKIIIETMESVNMLNLVEGEEAVVECPDGSFEPFTVHYGETFIVPEQIKKYSIQPINNPEGKKHAVIQAFIKNL
ncbi:MAG: mannose-6-phosphate isomerase [Anaerolineaceae bacterium]|nr:MAG: mannose-6-phosphate isomerase [Anaerolineaceae bacterium]